MNPRVHPGDPKRLLMIRKAFGYTQIAFAQILGLPRSTYLSLEHGETQIPQDVRRGVNDVTSCDPVPIAAETPPKHAISHLRQKEDGQLQVVPGQEGFWQTLRAQNYRVFHLENSRWGQLQINIRDMGMLTALSYLSLKTASLHFGFMFGAPAGQPDIVAHIAAFVAVLLLIPIIKAFSCSKVVDHFVRSALSPLVNHLTKSDYFLLVRVFLHKNEVERTSRSCR